MIMARAYASVSVNSHTNGTSIRCDVDEPELGKQLLTDSRPAEYDHRRLVLDLLRRRQRRKRGHESPGRARGPIVRR
jgi:hypothetical protein